MTKKPARCYANKSGGFLCVQKPVFLGRIRAGVFPPLFANNDLDRFFNQSHTKTVTDAEIIVSNGK